MLVKNIITYST